MASRGIKKRCSKLSACISVFSLLILAFGIVLIVTRFPQKYIDEQFKNHVIISLESPNFHIWIEPPPPVYMKYYIFNVTNKDDVIKGGIPNLVELGPYVYRMYVPRYNVAFYVNDTVASETNHTIVFQPHLSNGTEKDIVYHVNMPLTTIAEMIETMDMPPIGNKIFAKILDMIGEKNLFERHTVAEVLFGYVDPFFNTLNMLMSLIGKHYDPVFAPFHGFNNTGDGVYLTYTGQDDYSKTNEIQKWNGMEYLNFWTSKQANKVNGTDGSLFRPLVERNDTRYIFFSSMCRSLKLTYESDTTVKGVDTLRFHFADDLLANATEQPDNAGFCVPADNCYDNGVMNARSCLQNAPVLFSLPHFYNAAPQYQNGVTGLKPRKDLHDSHFDVEKVSGVVFSSVRSTQMNMEIQASKYIKQMKNIRHTICPIMWVAGTGLMDDKTCKEFCQITTLRNVMNVIGYVLLGVGAFVFLLTFVWMVVRSEKKKESVLLSSDHDNDDDE
ncbi:lysosome membrane protein 2-like [Styela clava]